MIRLFFTLTVVQRRACRGYLRGGMSREREVLFNGSNYAPDRSIIVRVVLSGCGLSGRTEALTLDKEATLLQQRDYIEAQLGCSCRLGHLIHSGRNLHWDAPLPAQGLCENDTIYATGRMRGGCERCEAPAPEAVGGEAK
eukprot:TRINITY_DN24327_c0_g1_i1.p2 TRINITY_DN24327_c0_g1~~TRINITY_DN24327_c0_g1_i1.p2  ORF type:complete len:140 (+),score=22.27 TRINITY_DN24327_c0_g1_i1:104-523(+)